MPSEESFARAGAAGLRLLAPLGKDPGCRRVRTPQRARHLDRFPATALARRRLQHPAAGPTTGCGPAPWNRWSGGRSSWSWFGGSEKAILLCWPMPNSSLKARIQQLGASARRTYSSSGQISLIMIIMYGYA
jgi:hypothetical protein